MRPPGDTFRRTLVASLLIALPAPGRPAIAQDTPQGAPRPLLEQLTRETEALYREVQRGVLRVELPPPRWMGEAAGRAGESPLTKYKDLDPKVREQLEQRARRAAAAGEPVARGPAGGKAIRVGDAGGNVAEARFVGSDRQTNLTVLRLVRPAGRPVRLGEADRP